MPTTRSRALRDNNTGAPEPTVAAQPTVLPPPDRKKRKHSRVETENVASTVLGDEKGAKVPVATALSAKKRKTNNKKTQGRVMVKKPSVPLPLEPVTVKVVNPTPPEVSQKALRSMGSVIAKFDPWKMRDDTPNDFKGYNRDDSEGPVDNVANNETAPTQSALPADEQIETEVLVLDDLATRHHIGGIEVASGTEAQATVGQNDESLDESDLQVLGDAPSSLGESIEFGNAKDDKGKPDFSANDSEETTRLPMSKNGQNSQRMTSALTNGHGEDNPHLAPEPPVLQEERDAEVEVDPIHCSVLLDAQIEATPEIVAIPDGSSSNAVPSAAFQEQSPFPVFVNSKTNGDSDVASSVYSEDAEGVVDEEHWDSVRIENSLGSVGKTWEACHALENEEHRAYQLDESGSNAGAQERGVEGEVESHGQCEVPSNTSATEYQKLATSNTLDGGIETSILAIPSENDEPSEHVKPDGTYDEAAPSDSGEDIDQRSSDSDDSENDMQLSMELDYLSDDSVSEHSGLDEQSRDEKGPGEGDHHAEEAARSDQDSGDELSDFSDDEDTEQQSPERDEDELENYGPEIMSEPVISETSRSSGETEGIDDDNPSSLFGNSRNMLVREEMVNWAIGGSEGITFPTGRGQFEHHVGVGHRPTTETEDSCISISRRVSQGDEESTYGYAESDKQSISQSAPEVDRGQENVPWRQPNAFENIHPSGLGIAERSSSVLSDVDTSSPQGVQGILGTLRSYQAVEATSIDALLKCIQKTLIEQLEIQKSEAIENARFRQLFISRFSASES